MTRDLPIEPVLPDLLGVLAQGRNAVLQAPPGAGKTTLVPLALLEAGWLAGNRIVMLEPRRLAARAAARRMATLVGGAVGETVGYRVRLDAKAGPATRVLVVTDGIFTRMIQDDPSLAGIGAVLFDEVHERSLELDLGLALALESQAALRPDLRLVAMSATLDGAALARLMGEAPVVTSAGRAFPVETRYLGAPADGGRGSAGAGSRSGPRLGDAAARAAVVALAEAPGDVLVFLPGAREIRHAAAALQGAELPAGTGIHLLHGDLAAAAQDAAIRAAAPGRRKIVLSTPIAETSLTIEGVTAVVDSGYARVPRFDPASGMSRLATVRISQAAAEQRRGRAGRLGPGRCYRLWSEAEQRALLPQTRPEMLEADLAPLALELAAWGARDPAGLAWLDPPPAAALDQARDLLRRLGALGSGGGITPHGRRMAGFGLHPRLSHMLIQGAALGHGRLACRIAALLEERDVLRPGPAGSGGRDADLRLRLELLESAGTGAGADRPALRRAAQMAAHWERRLRPPAEAPAGPGSGRPGTAGLLLAFAYPDRIGRRRAGAPGQFHLSNGRGAALPAADPLAEVDYLVAAELDGDRRVARIFLAAPLDEGDLESRFADAIETDTEIAWDGRAQAVSARRRRRLFALVLSEERLDRPDPEAVRAALLDGIRAEGLAILPWDPAALSLRARVAFLARLDGQGDGSDDNAVQAGWPDLSDAALLATLADWLGPYLDGITRRGQLARLDLAAALAARFDHVQRRRLDEEAPTHVTVPSGSRIAVDYGGEVPILAVRLQEMFGATSTPTVGGGRVPLLLSLLSPAGRPVQVTRDLAGFWAESYRAVRADLRGRYPKHAWPEDPRRAAPTRGPRRPARSAGKA